MHLHLPSSTLRIYRGENIFIVKLEKLAQYHIAHTLGTTNSNVLTVDKMSGRFLSVTLSH